LAATQGTIGGQGTARAIARHPVLRRILLIGPAAGFIVFFMALPLAIMAFVSFVERNINGGVIWGSYSFEGYIQFLFERQLDDSLRLNADYLRVFARSFWLSATTTIVALLVSLPTAFYMAVQPPRYRTILVFMVTIPFWSNLLIRNYSWILLLRDGGPINGLLLKLGLISTPIPLLYTDFAVAVGLTYSFLPFMILPIYASLEKLDWRLVEAAYDLYADRLRVLTRVILPLAKPGLLAGAILVFVPCLGAYVTPALLGGSKTMMIGNLIQAQFGQSRNWPFGAALAFFLLALVLGLMVLFILRQQRQREAAP